MLVRFVDEDLVPKDMGWNEALKVVWLGDYFKISELVVIMLQTFVIPQIDDENVVQLINEAYTKLKSSGKNNVMRQNSDVIMPDKYNKSMTFVNQEKEEDAWYTLLDKSLSYLSDRNPIAILKGQKTQHQIPKVILEEVIERMHKKSSGSPDSQMLKFLLTIKEYPTFLHLLHTEYENLQSIVKMDQGNELPILTWEVTGLKDNLLKESDPFVIDG